MKNIEWTDYTWNPITGCSPVSAGCDNCYARKRAKRLQKNPKTAEKYRNGFKPTFHPECLIDRKIWKYDKVFVGSMGDLFHDDFSDEQIFEILDNIQYISVVSSVFHKEKTAFQLLTKRPVRAVDIFQKYEKHNNHILCNIWLGVSVENQDTAWRIEELKKINKSIIKKRFVSFEPLLGEIRNLNLQNIDWVIVGGENGSGARPMKKEWVDLIFDEIIHCEFENIIPFFFKGWGKSKQSYNDNKNHDDVYRDYHWRQFPS